MQIIMSHAPLDQSELRGIVGRDGLEALRENRNSPALQAVVMPLIERGEANRKTAWHGAAGYATENGMGCALGAGQLSKELATDLVEMMREAEG